MNICWPNGYVYITSQHLWFGEHCRRGVQRTVKDVIPENLLGKALLEMADAILFQLKKLKEK